MRGDKDVVSACAYVHMECARVCMGCMGAWGSLTDRRQTRALRLSMYNIFFHPRMQLDVQL